MTDGTIFKSIPVSDEMGEVIAEQKQKFIEKFGRKPGPGDKLFFDMPPVEHAEHFIAGGNEESRGGPCHHFRL